VIKRIKVKSFQSHRSTEISPSPGVNVIVGRNMSGKSALLRALRLLLYNKPEGSDFVSWGDTNTEITVEYGDHVIRRIKGKRKNVYVVDDSEFTGFGRAVPQEVIDVLGVSPVRVDDAVYELNIGNPHDPPFLVSETNATKGKMFSRLAERLLGGLVRLDKAITKANTTLRRMNSESTVLTDEIVVTEGMLDVFLPLEGVEGKLNMCRDLLARATVAERNVDRLRSYSETLKQVEDDIEFGDCLVATYDFADVDSKMPEAANFQRELEVLTKSREYLADIDSAVDSLQARCSALDAIPTVSRAEELLEDLDSLRPLSSDLQRVDRAIHQAGLSQKRVADQLDKALHEYQRELLEAKRCPICFGPVDEHSIERILEELTDDGTSRDRRDGKESHN